MLLTLNSLTVISALEKDNYDKNYLEYGSSHSASAVGRRQLTGELCEPAAHGIACRAFDRWSRWLWPTALRQRKVSSRNHPSPPPLQVPRNSVIAAAVNIARQDLRVLFLNTTVSSRLLGISRGGSFLGNEAC